MRKDKEFIFSRIPEAGGPEGSAAGNFVAFFLSS
jgi:hypothetical protein